MLSFKNRVTGAAVGSDHIDRELCRAGVPHGYNPMPKLCKLYAEGLTVEEVAERRYAALRTSVSVEDYWMYRAASYIAEWYDVSLNVSDFVSALSREQKQELGRLLGCK